MGRRGGASSGQGRSHASQPKVSGGCSVQGQSHSSQSSRVTQNNRANQMNPNNTAYHKSRGNTSRPSNWHDIIEDRRVRGHRENELNLAAAQTSQQHAAHGRDVVHVESAVKRALGGAAQIWKGGGRAKHTGLANSDLDLKIVAPKSLTTKDRAAVASELKEEFGAQRVSDLNPRIHVVHGESGPIDVVPFDATYFPKGYSAGLPHNGFKYNPQARLAVRDVKLGFKEAGLTVRGYDAEMAVLRAQQANAGANFHELASFAGRELNA